MSALILNEQQRNNLCEKIEGVLWIKLLFSSIVHEQSWMIKVKVPSIGPIFHHRHLIHDTFKRKIPNDFTNHYTDNEPAVSQELPVMLLKVKPKLSQNIYCQAG